MDPIDDSEAGSPSGQNANPKSGGVDQLKLTGSSVSDDSGYETVGDIRDQREEISNISDPPQLKTGEIAEGIDEDAASEDVSKNTRYVALLEERLEKFEKELKELKGGE